MAGCEIKKGPVMGGIIEVEGFFRLPGKIVIKK